MSKFTKAVLKVGEYHSPDQTVVVTPERLQHWKEQVDRLQGAGYAIPMHWDHASNKDMDLLEPIKLDTLRRNKDRSAKNTVGKLVAFDVSQDGRSAEITVEALNKSAKESMEANSVFVSPVIFEQWKDGAGNQYTDTIGSVDLVDYPVDYKQGPFVPVADARMSCVIRMSSAPTKICRLSEMNMDDEKKDDETKGAEDVTKMSDDSPNDPSPEQPTTGGTSVADVLASLATLKIILPEDTTTENFLERLRPALSTAIAHGEQPDKEEEPASSLPPEEEPTVVTSPNIAAMSARLRAFENTLIEQGRENIKKRFDACLKSGRISPNEHGQMLKRVGVQKMSLDESNKVVAGDVALWLESRESLPAGAVWSPEERITRMGVTDVDQPGPVDHSRSISAKEEAAAVEALMKRSR
ncbi:hypothetical protein [Pirellula sp. SH-Sr6A]|uniref:hypothetical protein n=1 Tax=Pirellula sp. SH-Sr6A TaxID=1632865 RepID=UPI0011BA53A9|nr:hypothetical protein [Pirellula sp. SH-Sr6A]